MLSLILPNDEPAHHEPSGGFRVPTLAGLLVAALTCGSGCTLQGQHELYVAQQTFAPRASLAQVEADTDSVRALAGARSIQFVPPASCLAASSHRRAVVAGVACDSLMAELEAESVEAGFGVVAWRAPDEQSDLRAVVSVVPASVSLQDDYAGRDLIFQRETLDRAVPSTSLDPGTSQARERCSEAITEFVQRGTAEGHRLRVSVERNRQEVMSVERVVLDGSDIVTVENRDRVRRADSLGWQVLPASGLVGGFALAGAGGMMTLAEGGDAVTLPMLYAGAGLYILGLAGLLAPASVQVEPDPATELCAQPRPFVAPSPTTDPTRARRLAFEVVSAINSVRQGGVR